MPKRRQHFQNSVIVNFSKTVLAKSKTVLSLAFPKQCYVFQNGVIINTFTENIFPE